VLEGLQIIKLNHRGLGKGLIELAQPNQGVNTQKEKLSFDGFSVESQQVSTAPLRDPGGEVFKQGLIHMAFLLSKAKVSRGRGEAFPTKSALIALDPLFIASPAIKTNLVKKLPGVGR